MGGDVDIKIMQGRGTIIGNEKVHYLGREHME
jgi:hypothetical protein